MKWAVSRFLSRTGIFVVFRRLLFLSIADAHSVSVRIHAGEKQWQQRACGRRRGGNDVPSWCQIVTRILREKPPDALNSRTRNASRLANPNNEFINKICLEERNGVSCGGQVAPFPTNSPSSPTDNHPVLSIVCTNHPSVSPARLSVAPHAIQNSTTQINAVVIRVRLKLSEAGANVFKLNGI